MKNYINESGEIVWTKNQKRMLKHLVLEDGLAFFRYFFKCRTGQKLKINWHHLIIEYCLQAVLDLRINKLIINIAPGHTKTEHAVNNFIARGLAINNKAKFMHLSYSQKLATKNSADIRDTVSLKEYQELFDFKIKKDRANLMSWLSETGGGITRADSAGGTVTGFRAGYMDNSKFTGALVIDDPVKPNDAKSDIMRTKINARFNNTIKSRLAHDQVPMIVIMQRIHEEDLSGYLLKGGSDDQWIHLNIPAILDDYDINDYPKEYSYGLPVDLKRLMRCIKTGEDFNF